jgi:apolipoprotein N-acyltransferase
MLPFFLVVLSASLYVLSFPPLSFAPLIWVALIPFFIAVSIVQPHLAAMLEMLWGLLVAYGVAWWFPQMVAKYLEVSLTTGWVSLFVVSVGLAGVYFSAFAAWLSWLVRQHAANPFLVAVGWGVCEFVRATLFIGNPWALIGYS